MPLTTYMSDAQFKSYIKHLSHAALERINELEWDEMSDQEKEIMTDELITRRSEGKLGDAGVDDGPYDEQAQDPDSLKANS